MKNGFSKVSLSINNIMPFSHSNGAFETILRALNDNNQLNISYYSPLKNTVIERRISPIHFFFCEGCWYLHSYCELRKEARMFRLDRIIKIKYLEEKIPASHIEIFNKSLYLETVTVSLKIEQSLYNRCAGILEKSAVENLVSWFKRECIYKMDKY